MYLSQCSSLLAFLLAIFIGTYTDPNLKYHHLETSFERAPGSHQLMFKVSLVVSTSRPIEIEIENVLGVETNF
jgi:hypothetical protein